jgi:hypothetical protein
MLHSFRGYDILQLPDEFPILRLLYTSYELNFETEFFVQFSKDHFLLPLVAVSVYLAAIAIGQRIMAKRERFDLRYPLASWNALLSIFSFMGASRTVPHLIWNLSRYSLTDTICVPPDQDWGLGAAGFWVGLFIYSKVFELWDTFFIVARKRPLNFIHWYHHVTVLLYCWHSYATEASQALYFIAMNYSVHGVMYGYYCLMALRIMPRWIPSWPITIFQIAQMFVGVAVQISAMVLYTRGSKCPLSFSNLVCGGIMYGSYLVLFVHFAVQRYVFGSKSKAE